MKLIYTESTALLRFSISRFFISIIAYFSAIGLYLFICPKSLLTNPSPAFEVSLFVLVLSLFGRIYLWRKYRGFLDEKKEAKFLHQLPALQAHFIINALVGALAWSALFTATIAEVGSFTPESMIVYFTMVSILTTGGPTYAGNKWVWMSFIICLIVVPIAYSVLADPARYSSYAVGAFVCCVFIYQSGIITAKHAKSLFEEQARQKTQAAYFKSVIEAVPGLVTIFDQNLQYRLINSRVVKFSGLPENAFEGKHVGFGASTEFSALVEKFQKSPISYFQTRLQLEGREGARWFIVTMSRLIRDSQIAVVSMDIDDHMKAEQAALDQRAAAESSARLAAVGELAAGIAHEINNPLAVITSKSEQTIRKLQNRQLTEFIPDIEKIRATGFRIANIVRGLKNLSRNGDSDPYVDSNINEIVADVTAVFEAKLKSFAINIEVNIPKDVSAECHPTQVGQVLMNLVSNSFDVLRSSPEGWIRIEAKNVGAEVEISVTDSGSGIPESIRTKLMTPFFTTKAAGMGTGLGLSISRRIAHDHNGDFYLDEKSEHTRFVLRIPKSHQMLKAA